MNETYRDLLRPPQAFHALTDGVKFALRQAAAQPAPGAALPPMVLQWLDPVLDSADQLTPFLLRAWCFDGATALGALHHSWWLPELGSIDDAAVERVAARFEAVLCLLSDSRVSALGEALGREVPGLGFEVPDDVEIDVDDIVAVPDLWDAANVCALVAATALGPHRPDAVQLAQRVIAWATAGPRPPVWEPAMHRLAELLGDAVTVPRREFSFDDLVGLTVQQAEPTLDDLGYPFPRGRRYVARDHREVVVWRTARWVIVHVHLLAVPGSDQGQLTIVVDKV